MIDQFKATSVYGYLDFQINFNSDVSFLVGGNGSGKTTALRLINALLRLDIRELIRIPFAFCSVILDQENSYEITAILKEETVEIFSSTCKHPLSLPLIVDDGMHQGRSNIDDIADEVKLRNADHPLLKEVAEIDPPIFLGLDRRRDSSPMDQIYFHDRDIVFDQSRGKSRPRRQFRGSIGASLVDAEMLVQQAYKRIRELENRQSRKLRDKLLASSFSYAQFDEKDLRPDKQRFEEGRAMLRREKEIKKAICNISGNDPALSEQVDLFFSKIRNLLESSAEGEEIFAIEWLLNKAQFVRMASLVKIIDEHKSIIDKFYDPINKFLSTVNEFYLDSNKNLDVNAVGRLVVKRPDKKTCSIEALSSGERQLLVIFAQVYFALDRKKKSVLIIDEPELSLHLGWQEKFAETIFSINANCQFILATHSPEIIAVDKNKAVSCRPV